MTATILVHLAIAIAGALVYAFAGNPRAYRMMAAWLMGEIAFFVGLLWTVYTLSGSKLHL